MKNVLWNETNGKRAHETAYAFRKIKTKERGNYERINKQTNS